MRTQLEPITPGEILQEEFMNPIHLSQNKLARDIDVPVARINDIIHGKRSITPDTAFRLAIYFGTTPEFWLNLQVRFDIKKIEKTSAFELKKKIRKIQAQAV